MIVITTETIPGRAFDAIGEVVGVTARPLNPYTEGIKTLDGKSRLATPSLLRWRREAIAQMVTEAQKIGADAVVGMRFDNRHLTSAWAEICAYGTAVRFAERPVGRHAETPTDRDRAVHVGRVPPVQPPTQVQ